MKQFRVTLAIFIFFIGLLGYYYFIESKKKKGEEIKEIYVFDLKNYEFKNIEIIDMTENSHILLKKDKDWKIEKPKELPASKKVLDEIITVLTDLKADREVNDDPKNLKLYGLDVPKYKVKFTTGDKEHILLVGEKNPTNAFYFVKEENRNIVYTVDSFLIEKVTRKNLSDLRDKGLFPISEKEISKIEIKTKGKKELSIEKDKNMEWMVSSASDWDLTLNIQNIIDELKNLSIEEFMEDSSLNPANYGLTNYSYSVNIHKNDGGTVLFQFGKEEGNSIYVKRDTENIFYKVDRRLINNIENLYSMMEELDKRDREENAERLNAENAKAKKEEKAREKRDKMMDEAFKKGKGKGQPLTDSVVRKLKMPRKPKK